MFLEAIGPTVFSIDRNLAYSVIPVSAEVHSTDSAHPERVLLPKYWAF